jgi:hypothetical protein
MNGDSDIVGVVAEPSASTSSNGEDNMPVDTEGRAKVAAKESDCQRWDFTLIFESLADQSETDVVVVVSDDGSDDWMMLTLEDDFEEHEEWEELGTVLPTARDLAATAHARVLNVSAVSSQRPPSSLLQDLEVFLSVACRAQAAVERLISPPPPPIADTSTGKVPNVIICTIGDWRTELWAIGARLNWRSQRSDTSESVSSSKLCPESVWHSLLTPDMEVLKHRGIERVEVCSLPASSFCAYAFTNAKSSRLCVRSFTSCRRISSCCSALRPSSKILQASPAIGVSS